MTTGDVCHRQFYISESRENIKAQLLRAEKWNCEKRNSGQSHRAVGEGAVGKQHRSNVETPQAVQTALLLLFLRRPSPLPQPPNPFFSSSYHHHHRFHNNHQTLFPPATIIIIAFPTTNPHFCGRARCDSRFPTPCPLPLLHSLFQVGTRAEISFISRETLNVEIL